MSAGFAAGGCAARRHERIGIAGGTFDPAPGAYALRHIVRAQADLVITACTQFAFIGDAVVVAVAARGVRDVAAISNVIVITVRFAFVRRTVPGAVLGEAVADIALIEDTVVVAVRLTPIGNTVVVTIRST